MATLWYTIVNAFSLLLQNLAYEIILTLGQAFEVAYQLALQARKGGHSSTLPESFENKPSKPIPKPRVSIRKSVVSRKDNRCSENLELEGEKVVKQALSGVGPHFSVSLGLLLACILHPPSLIPAKSWGMICLNLEVPKKTSLFLCPGVGGWGGDWMLLLFLDESFLKVQESLGMMFSEASLPSHQGPEPLAGYWPLEWLAEVHSKVSQVPS